MGAERVRLHITFLADHANVLALGIAVILVDFIKKDLARTLFQSVIIFSIPHEIALDAKTLR